VVRNLLPFGMLISRPAVVDFMHFEPIEKILVAVFASSRRHFARIKEMLNITFSS